MKVFLVGLPGSGKSTIGKLLSKSLKYDFYDLDAEIVKSHKRSINDIFNEEGEEYFRKLEREELQKLISKEENMVIATGGGTPAFHENMLAMNKSGISVFIDVDLTEATKRLYHSSKSERPMVKNLSEEEITSKIKSLYQSRINYYSQSKLSFISQDQEAKEFSQKIYLALIEHI